MAKKSGRNHCVKCNKERATSKCGGCRKDFCWNDLVEHRQDLNIELDGLQTERNLLRETLSEKMKKPELHSIISEIDQWEKTSIKKINEAAENARKIALSNCKLSMDKIEQDLSSITNQMRQHREENDFFETDIQEWRNTLDKLKHQLTQPRDVRIRFNQKSAFISELIVETTESFEKRQDDYKSISSDEDDKGDEKTDDEEDPYPRGPMSRLFSKMRNGSYCNCEFCGVSVREYDLQSHQSNCKRNYRKTSSAKKN